MRHAILSALSLTSLLVASPAFAKTSGDKTAASFSSAIDGVQLSGTVEVPIYDVPGFETVPVVAVQVGETRLFLALEPMADEIVLSGPRVAALGLEGKGKKDGSVASATVESIQVGELTLSGVEVATKFPKSHARWSTNSSIGRTQALSLDGYIGLQSLGDIAWAIVPSAGVARFAPAGTSGLIGDSTAVPSTDGTLLKLKKGKSKVWQAPAAHVAAMHNGKEIRVTLEYTSTRSVLAASLRPGDLLLHSGDGVRYGVTNVQVGGAKVQDTFTFDAGIDTRDQYDMGDMVSADGTIGRNVLGQLDIARDNSSGQMSFAVAKESKRADPVPLMLADAEAALAKAKEKAPDAEEEVLKDTTLPEGNAGAWTTVAKAREAAGDFKGSLEAWETAAKFEPNGCQGWLEYGVRVVEYGNPADAKEAMEKASSLYHGWWDWHANVREALGKVLEKADEAGQDYFFEPDDIGFVEIDSIRERDVAMGAPAPLLPEQGALVKSQPDTCDSADGYLAHIAMLEGDSETVEKLYRERFDLDPYLADIQGASALVFGEPIQAHEALRQAIIREWHSGPDEHRRANLAQAYIADGDREQAQLLLDKAVALAPSDLVILDQWLANMSEQMGPHKVLVAAQKLADAHPISVGAQLNWLAAATAAKAEGPAGKAKARAEALLASQMVHNPNSAELWIARSRLAAAKNNSVMAASSAKKATELAPGWGLGWVAAAEAADMQGDADKAAELRAKAAQVSPRVYYYSQVLADSDAAK